MKKSSSSYIPSVILVLIIGIFFLYSAYASAQEAEEEGSFCIGDDCVSGLEDATTWKLSGKNIYNTNSGNVGIGTPTPWNKLQVKSSGGFPNNVPIVAQSESTFFGALDPAGMERFAINLNWDGTSYPVTFYDKYDNNWHDSLTLKNGNVGIGTTNPEAKLHVDNGGGFAIGGSSAISDTYGAKRTIQLATQTGINGGIHDNHTGALIWSTLESGGWPEGGYLKVALSNEWGSYNTTNPALILGQRYFHVGADSMFVADTGSPNTSFLRFGSTAVSGKSSAKMEFAGWGILHGGLRFIPYKDANGGPHGVFSFSMGGEDDPDAQSRQNLLAIGDDGNVHVGGNLSISGANMGYGGVGRSGNGIAFPSTLNDAQYIYGEHDGSDTSNLIFHQRDNWEDGVIFRNTYGDSNYNPQQLDYMKISRGGMWYVGEGNVGIGTPSPSSKLDVAGTITSSVGQPLIFTAIGSGTFNKTAIYNTIENGFLIDLAKKTDNVNGIPINFNIDARGGGKNFFHIEGSNGNVGIGTTSPGVKLHVVGSAFFDQGAVCCGIHFRQENAGRLRVGAAWGIPGLYSEDNQDIVLGVAGGKKAFIGSSGNFMTVQGDGNVGIGTPSPVQAKLVISNGGLANTSGWGGNDIVFGNANGSSAFYHEANNVYWYTSSGQAISLRPAGSEAMRIATNGNVGIGTTSPKAKLHVNGSLFLSDASGGDASRWGIYGWGNQLQFSLRNKNDTWTHNSLPLAIQNDGRVFINNLCLGTEPCRKSWGGATSGSTGAWTVSGTNLYSTNTSNNVGIGTASPTQGKLVVSGGNIAMDTSGNAFVDLGANNRFRFCGPGGNCSTAGEYIGGRIRLSPNGGFAEAEALKDPGMGGINAPGNVYIGGNVGIGTVTPQGALHIASGKNGVMISQNMIWGMNGNNREGNLYLNIIGGNILTSLNSSQKVGIGTTVPDGKLVVAGTGGGGTIRVWPISNGGESSIGFKQSSNGTGVEWVMGQNSWSAGSGNFAIGGNGSGKLYILSNGNVGIGTNNPGHALEVNGITRSNNIIAYSGDRGGIIIGTPFYENANNKQNYISFQAWRDSYNGDMYAFQGASIGTQRKWVCCNGFPSAGYPGVALTDLIFFTRESWDKNVGPAERMRITYNGNVGINQPNPAYKLDVVGAINVAFNDSNSQRLALDDSGYGMDIAELFDAIEEVEEGDVLMVSDKGNKVRRSLKIYQKGLLGVVSSAPAIVFEGGQLKLAPDPQRFTKGIKPPVTLAGRVLVKVSSENGFIKPGDYLTSSSVPGVAMKATETGPTVGIALEPFSSDTPGKVLVFVNVGENNLTPLIEEVRTMKDSYSTMNKRVDQLEQRLRK